MAYHDDLLAHALALAHKSPATQADFRRAVSAAYYALFHLLISETIANWNLDSSRAALGRMFEHSSMKKASSRVSDLKLFPFRGEEPSLVDSLRLVAESFVQLQDRRHIADYDCARAWTRTQTQMQVQVAELAFLSWQAIRHERIAQDYLVSLLIKQRD